MLIAAVELLSISALFGECEINAQTAATSKKKMSERSPLLSRPSPEESYTHADEKTVKPAALDWLFLKRFSRLLSRYLYNRSIDGNLRLATIALLVASALTEVCIYYIGTLTSRFYSILLDRNFDVFLVWIAKGAGLFALSGLLKATQKLVQGRVHIRGRSVLTSALHEVYFDEQRLNFYHWNTSPSLCLDNVDQRQTQDVDLLTASWSHLIGSTILTPFLIAYYAYETIISSGYTAPLIIFAYFVVTSIICAIVSSPLPKRIYDRERAEGVFRNQHMRVCTNAEQIGLWKASQYEKRQSDTLLLETVATQAKVLDWEFWINWSTTFSAEFGTILSFLALAVPVFQGHYDDTPDSELAGIISKNAFFVLYLLNKFTNLIELADSISQLAGYVARVSRVFESDEQSRKLDGNLSKPNVLLPVTDTNDSDVVKIANFKCSLPNGKILSIRNFTVPRQIYTRPALVMICGPSGVGKTSFTRALGGLLPMSGELIFDGNQVLAFNFLEVTFVPQTPQLCNGDLIDQILYPTSRMDAAVPLTDEKLIQLLRIFGLQSLISKISDLSTYLTVDNGDELVSATAINYDGSRQQLQALSAGERQRLLLLRIVYHKPRVVFLDESTCSMDSLMEERCLRYLIEQERIRVVWINHHSHSEWISKVEDEWDITTYTMKETGDAIVFVKDELLPEPNL